MKLCLRPTWSYTEPSLGVGISYDVMRADAGKIGQYFVSGRVVLALGSPFLNVPTLQPFAGNPANHPNHGEGEGLEPYTRLVLVSPLSKTSSPQRARFVTPFYEGYPNLLF